MNLIFKAKIQKWLLTIPLFLCITLSPVFSQVAPAPTTGAPTAPTPSTGTPSSTQGTPSTQGTTTNPTTNQQTPAKAQDAQTIQDAKSTTEDALKVNDQEKNNALEASRSEADMAKVALRNKIFGYTLFSQGGFNPIPNQQIATPRDYTIGPGDNLNIYIYGYAQLPDQDVVVSRDGFISLPRIGNVFVGGKSIEEAQKILLDKYSRFIPSLLGSGGQAAPTKLMLTLGQIRSINIFVTGQVINPGSYELTSLSSAFNALFLAGGPNEQGTFREVRVIRNGKVASTFDIYEYLTQGSLKGDIRLQENDNVNVGFYIKRVELIGTIKNPGIYEVKEGEKLSEIIAFAGGFKDDAYRERVKVYRFTPRERKIIDVSASQFDSFELVSGDEIEVETILNRFENIVTLQGAVFRPGEYSVDSNPTLKVLLDNAQGVREDAFLGRISVSRTRADQSVENISINLADILNGSVPDLMLTRLDVITIPSKFDIAQQSTVHIQGELNKAEFGETGGTYPYMTNMTIEDLILKAGGFKESAKYSQVEVVRRVRNSNAQAADAAISEVFRFSVNPDLTLNSQANGFVLMPFDEVIVRKSPNYQEQQFVTLEGEFLNPGSYGIISKNEKITDLVQRSGGLTDLAYIKGATLIRTTPISEFESQQTSTALGQISTEIKKGAIMVGSSGSMRQEFINIRLDKILKNPNSDENIIIQENDILRIPKRLETVQVQGALLYPTTVKYNDEMSFLDYISQSGGFTKNSLRRSSYVKYPNGSVDRTRKFLVFNVYPKVEPGSEIYVPVRAGNDLTPQQILQQGISITSTLFTLILSVLAFRTIR